MTTKMSQEDPITLSPSQSGGTGGCRVLSLTEHRLRELEASVQRAEAKLERLERKLIRGEVRKGKLRRKLHRRLQELDDYRRRTQVPAQ